MAKPYTNPSPEMQARCTQEKAPANAFCTCTVSKGSDEDNFAQLEALHNAPTLCTHTVKAHAKRWEHSPANACTPSPQRRAPYLLGAPARLLRLVLIPGDDECCCTGRRLYGPAPGAALNLHSASESDKF